LGGRKSTIWSKVEDGEEEAMQQRLEALEKLAVTTRDMVSQLARLEVAEYVYQECPGDEAAEGRFRDALVRTHEVRGKFLFHQLQELQREGWRVQLHGELETMKEEPRSLVGQILDLGEATLHLAAAMDRRTFLEEELWLAIDRGHKPEINIAALATMKALIQYQDALKVLLGARSTPGSEGARDLR
jgi:hypothetical protein